MGFHFRGGAARAAAVGLLALVLSSPAFAVTKTWTNNNGSGDGKWGTAANWNPSGVPTAADDVEIGVTDQTSNLLIIDTAATANSVTVGNAFTNNPTLEVRSGQTLTIAAASSVASGATLDLNNGNLSGAGALTLNGTLTQRGGTIGGTGGLTINSGGSLNFTGTVNSCYLSRSTTNNGTITFASTTNFYYHAASSVLTNNGLVDFQADEDFWNGGGTPRIDNQSSGIVTKSGGAGTAAIRFAVNNAGTLESDLGTLSLTIGGTHSGNFTVSSETLLRSVGAPVTAVLRSQFA